MSAVQYIPHLIYPLQGRPKNHAIMLLDRTSLNGSEFGKISFQIKCKNIQAFGIWEEADRNDMVQKVTYIFQGELIKRYYLQKTAVLGRTYSHEDMRLSPCAQGMAVLVLYWDSLGKYHQSSFDLILKE